MTSAELSHRVEKVVGYPPLSEMDGYRLPLPGQVHQLIRRSEEAA